MSKTKTTAAKAKAPKATKGAKAKPATKSAAEPYGPEMSVTRPRLSPRGRHAVEAAVVLALADLDL